MDAGDDASSDAGTGMDASGPLHPAYPVLPNNGGAMTSSVFIFSIIATNDAALSQLQSFGAALPTSNWWSAVSATYDLGTASHVELVGASLASGITMTQAQMVAYIRQTITNAGWTLGTGLYEGNTISVLYLPDGVIAEDNDANCSFLQGYHTVDAADSNFIWAVSQRCPGWAGIPDKVQNSMSTASHEIAEAATDPIPPNGYMLPSTTNPTASPPPAQNYSPFAYAPPEGEVGDMCAGTYEVEGAFTYQRIWSNTAAAGGDPCVPSSSLPYECASTLQGWYPIEPGMDTTITVSGWSTASTASTWETWAAMVASEPANAFAVNNTSFTLGNSGQMENIFPAASSGAVSGDFGVMEVISLSSTSSEQHIWSVGVYVP